MPKLPVLAKLDIGIWNPEAKQRCLPTPRIHSLLPAISKWGCKLLSFPRNQPHDLGSACKDTQGLNFQIYYLFTYSALLKFTKFSSQQLPPPPAPAFILTATRKETNNSHSPTVCSYSLDSIISALPGRLRGNECLAAECKIWHQIYIWFLWCACGLTFSLRGSDRIWAAWDVAQLTRFHSQSVLPSYSMAA